jgi:hypothetical protein
MTKESLKLIFQTLGAHNIRYMVVGGLAVNAHGYLRLTLDVDLLIDLAPDNITRALEALNTLGYRPHVPITNEQFASAENRARWMDEKGMKVLKLFSDAHRETVIDVFVSDPLGFDAAYTRAKYELLGGDIAVFVCSYADLVKLKRDASRPKDLSDLAELKRIRGEP